MRISGILNLRIPARTLSSSPHIYFLGIHTIFTVGILLFSAGAEKVWKIQVLRLSELRKWIATIFLWHGRNREPPPLWPHLVYLAGNWNFGFLLKIKDGGVYFHFLLLRKRTNNRVRVIGFLKNFGEWNQIKRFKQRKTEERNGNVFFRRDMGMFWIIFRMYISRELQRLVLFLLGCIRFVGSASGPNYDPIKAFSAS